MIAKTIARTLAQVGSSMSCSHPSRRVMGGAYREVRLVPNEITYSTPCKGNEKIDRGQASVSTP